MSSPTSPDETGPIRMSLSSRFENIEMAQHLCGKLLEGWDLNEETTHWILMALREALANVRRHSGSTICRVKMGFAARPFLIEVSDEGRGFAAPGLSGYGLMGMRERAAGIGGRLEVVSTEGRGTTVFLFGPN